MKKKKYQKPILKAKKITLNYFYSRRGRYEGVLLAGCTCTYGNNSPGSCGCSGQFQ